MDKQDGMCFMRPLENHVILKHLFNCMGDSTTFQDWKNIRLVCKLWHNETLTRWRSTAMLSFVVHGILDPPLTSRTTTQLFLDELQNPDSPYKLKEIPYQRYKLAELSVALSDIVEYPEASPFWNLVGPCVKHLTFLAGYFYFYNGTNANVIKFLVDVTPNLKSVVLDGFSQGTERFLATAHLSHPNLKSLHLIGFCGTDLKLSAFPNLQELTVTNYGLSIFLQVIGANMIHPHHGLGHSTVRRLEFVESRMVNDDTFNMVIPYVRFPSLEHLSVIYRYLEDDVRFLTTFVTNHRKTLKKLEVLTSINNPIPEVCSLSTELPVLTEVRLWGNVIKSLGFLKFTPNLKLLHLDLYGEEKADKMIERLYGNVRGNDRRTRINTQIVQSTVESGVLSGIVLQKLEYFQVNCFLSQKELQNLSGWMPNLKTLKIVVIPDTVSVVCKSWPKLEQLACLSGSLIEDENVTGNIEENGLVALVDSKHLRSFQFNEDCDTSTLTDACVAKGFMKMMELTHLDICVSPEFTSEAETMLSEHVQNVNVYRNHAANWNANLKCCKNRYYHQALNRFDFYYQPNTLEI